MHKYVRYKVTNCYKHASPSIEDWMYVKCVSHSTVCCRKWTVECHISKRTKLHLHSILLKVCTVLVTICGVYHLVMQSVFWNIEIFLPHLIYAFTGPFLWLLIIFTRYCSVSYFYCPQAISHCLHCSSDKGVSKNNIPSIGRFIKKVESFEARIKITSLRSEASYMKIDITMAKITGQLESVLQEITSIKECQNMLFRKLDLIHSTLLGEIEWNHPNTPILLI